MFTGEPEKAVEAIEKAIRLAPDQSDLYIDAAGIYFDLDRDDDAMNALKKAVKLSPDSAQAHYLLSEGYQETGKERKAIEELKKAIDLEPDDVGYRSSLAYLYLNSWHV